jgi:predicted hydrocarbon binding protein
MVAVRVSKMAPSAGREEESRSEQRKLDDFYDFTIASGEIRIRRTHSRSFVLPTSSWGALRAALQSVFGDGAPALMRQIGYIVGASFARELRESGEPPLKAASVIPDAGRVSGWGALALSGDTEGWSRVTATVSNCPICELEGPGGAQPRCDVIAGILNGLVDGIFEKPHSVTEKRCGHGSDRECEFLITETSEQPEQIKNWASYVLFPWLSRKQP